MSDRLLQATRRLCAAREERKALERGMLHCLRRPYFDGFGDEGPEYTTPSEPQNPGGVFCSRAMVADYDAFGGLDYIPLMEEDWCEHCRANIPAVRALRVVRARMGGLTAAVMSAYRAEEKS